MQWVDASSPVPCGPGKKHGWRETGALHQHLPLLPTPTASEHYTPRSASFLSSVASELPVATLQHSPTAVSQVRNPLRSSARH